MKIIFIVVFSLLIIGHCYHHRIKQLRIVGGYIENIERFPFTAAIVVKNVPNIKDDVFAGGAVILSNFWAITAAHCVCDLMTQYVPLGYVYLRSNTTYWQGPQSQYLSNHQVTAVLTHELYNSASDDYDIAAMKVKQKFSAKHEVPAPALAGEGYKYTPGTRAIVLGWGTTNVTSENDPTEVFTVPHLRAVEVKIVDFEHCVQTYRAVNEVITSRMLCASAPGKDACVNDSGGPLVQNNTVIGLVSWGVGCAKAEYPGIYTRVSAVRGWIENIKRYH